MYTRVILIILDGVGVGALPDAASYGDAGSNTLGNIAAQVRLDVPTLRSLGLDRVVTLAPPHALNETHGGTPASARFLKPGELQRGLAVAASGRVGGKARRHEGAAGRMAERSPGKDSVTGHWELMGAVIDRAFPTFPHGFPTDLIAAFERDTGRRVIGNTVASGTAILDALGPLHMRDGALIVYTSADSVFQIAAHEDVVPVAELYRCCELAFRLAVEQRGIGRVIARPFIGQPGSFVRTANRHDYAMPPPQPTLLDALVTAGHQVTAVGKVHDLFAGRGITTTFASKNDREGMAHIDRQLHTQERGLIFANLVDFDTVFGHRNDVAGFAANLEAFDGWLGGLLPRLAASDLLLVTADHGNDPTTASTDHSREYVPLLVAGEGVRAGADLGTRGTFADVAQTLGEVFGVPPLISGHSFLADLRG